jgi:hypothetical protein
MIWIDSENWSGLQPLQEFEEAQQKIREEKMFVEQENQLKAEQQLLEKEQEEANRPIKQPVLTKNTKSAKSKKSKAKNFFGNANQKDEESEEEEDNAGEQDYSFLDDIHGKKDEENANNASSYEINLKDIKKKTQQLKFKKAIAFDSDDEGSLAEEEEEDDDEEKGHYSRSQSQRSQKKRYDSIEDLLDTFEDGNNLDDEGLPMGRSNTLDEAPPTPLVQHWNMINHLPEAAVTYFQYTVGKKILFIKKYFSGPRKLICLLLFIL